MLPVVSVRTCAELHVGLALRYASVLIEMVGERWLSWSLEVCRALTLYVFCVELKVRAGLIRVQLSHLNH